jgi:hypothetical protein
MLVNNIIIIYKIVIKTVNNKENEAINVKKIIINQEF